MMVHLAWFGLGVLTTLTAVCLVMLEHMRRLDRDCPPMKRVKIDVDREVQKALAEWDSRFHVMQPPLASGIKGIDQTGRRLH